MPDDLAWGASVRMDLVLRNRSRFLSSIRHLIGDVCEEHLEPCESTSYVQMVVNELLENVVKYSAESRATLEFDLCLMEQQPMVRVCTINAADPKHISEVQKLLREMNSAADPVRFYEAMIARSGERPGSGLGLIRIRAEAGLNLRGWFSGNQLGLEATGPVLARRLGL